MGTLLNVPMPSLLSAIDIIRKYEGFNEKAYPDPETGEVPQAEIALPNDDDDLRTLKEILKTKIPAEYKRSHENNPTHPFYSGRSEEHTSELQSH